MNEKGVNIVKVKLWENEGKKLLRVRGSWDFDECESEKMGWENVL